MRSWERIDGVMGAPSLGIDLGFNPTMNQPRPRGDRDGYYVAYKPITLSSILFMFVEMKFIHCHSCVMFAMKSMTMCND